jgi:hypothetical protein
VKHKKKTNIKRSKILLGYYACCLVIATLLISFINLPFRELFYLYVLIVGISFFYFHFSQNRIQEILWHEHGLIDLKTEKTVIKNVKLLPGSRVMSKLIILSFKIDKKFYLRRKVIILPDSLDKESFRQLKVFLRFYLQH